MKKLLILAYDFPPYVSVGGLRPYSWYKYLKEYDVEPIVITRQWNNHHGNHLDYIAPGESKTTITEQTEFGTIIRTPYQPNLANKIMLKYGNKKFRLFRKIISAYYEIMQFVFNVGPKVQLYFAAKAYLKNNKVDAIIATGDPFVLFRYAHKLSKKYDIPWIADYRDPWTQSITISNNKLNFFLNKTFEKKIVKNALFISTVSNFVKENIAQLLKSKKFIIIPNGYDPEIINQVKHIPQSSQILQFAITGTIYKWHPWKQVFNMFDRFIHSSTNPKIQINLYGVSNANEISDYINSNLPSLHNYIKIHPKISNNIYLKELAKNNIMLLFNQYAYMGTKIYDFIGLNRLILLCFSDDPEANKLKQNFFDIKEKSQLRMQEDIIHQYNAGYVVKDAHNLLEILHQLYSEFTKNNTIACNALNAEHFSRKYQTEKLAKIIHKLHNPRLVEQLQCRRCVMDTSDPDITFDQQGFCNHCTHYINNLLPQTYQGEASNKKLQSLLNDVRKKGKNKTYDCVVGVSGGVDSLYVLWLAKTQWNLRPLAVHMDNGWNSELAVDNIEKICKKLNVDLHTEVLDYQEFADLQLAFLKASVIEAETPTDIAIPAVLHKVAAQHGIKYIFSGGNYATEGILPKFWHYDAKDTKYLYGIHKKFGKIKLKTFPTFGYKKEFYYKFFKGIRMAYPLNKVPYDKKEAVRILEQELGWRNYGGKHHESIYTKWVQSYYLFVKFGIDYRKATYSSQICTGALTREKALEDLKKLPYNPATLDADIEYLCKKLYITRDEYNQIMQKPAKTYKDYPNNEKFLNFIYNLYKKIK